MLINASTLRLVWTVIESTPTKNLLSPSDTALVSTVVEQTSGQTYLSEDEINSLSKYVRSKLSLIRDIADTRCSC